MDYVKNIDLCRCLSLLLVVCTQSVEEFTAPVTREYKLECWGARGGKRLKDTSAYPGNGGYSRGTKKLAINNSIYICVGQTRDDDVVLYNNRPDGISSFPGGPAGGGATSVTTTNRGELKYFSNYQSEVLIVAGGGGGCVWAGQGGAGGGKTGIDGKTDRSDVSPNGTGGNQKTGGITGARSGTVVSSHGKFGLGGFGYLPNAGGLYGSQGGGGWYGGGGSAYSGAAGGGSSYIDGVDNGETKKGNEKMPDPLGGDDITGNSGNGYCVISWFLE